MKSAEVILKDIEDRIALLKGLHEETIKVNPKDKECALNEIEGRIHELRVLHIKIKFNL